MEISVWHPGGGHNLLFESFGANMQHRAGVERADMLVFIDCIFMYLTDFCQLIHARVFLILVIQHHFCLHA